MIRGIVTKLHPHVFLTLLAIKLATVLVVIGLRRRRASRLARLSR